MKILFIHKYGGLGGVTAGIRNKHILMKRLGIDSDFLFMYDIGSREVFKGLELNLYQSKDVVEIREIICKNIYNLIISIDSPDVHEMLNNLPERIVILCAVHTTYPDEFSYVKKNGFPKRARFIITPSEIMAKRIKKEIDKRNSMPVCVIPNFVENRFFEIFQKRDNKTQVEKKYIGWIGRFDKLKNYQEALKIAAKLSSSRKDTEFFLVGQFPSGASIRFYNEIVLKKKGINLKWLPFISHQQIHRFYGFLAQSGGCFITTSHAESFGNTIIESMASGCPVVAPNIEIFNEQTDNGKCGAIYRLGNKKNAVETINRVLDEDDYRAELINNAYMKVKKNFSTEVITMKWIETLNNIRR